MPKAGTHADGFLPEVCKLRHEEIDKRFTDISTQIDDHNESTKNEILGAIKGIQDTLNLQLNFKEENLKNKIIVTERSINEKIDVLDEFHSLLKGNGHPSVFESIRSIKFRQNIVIGSLIVIFFFLVVGDYRGVSISKIRKFLGLESKQIVPNSLSDEKSPASVKVPSKSDQNTPFMP